MLSGTWKKVWWNVEAGFDKWVEEVLERVTPGNVLAIKFQTKFAFKVKAKGIERSKWDINGTNCWYLSLGTPNRQLWLLKLGCWKIRAKLHFRDTQVNLGWGLFPGPMIIWSIVCLFNDVAEKVFQLHCIITYSNNFIRIKHLFAWALVQLKPTTKSINFRSI